MTCLNDLRIQALADGEPDAAAAAHAAACASCAARLRDRIALMTSIERSLDVPVVVPPALAHRVEDVFRLKAEATENVRTRAEATRKGATRLRDPEADPPGLDRNSRGFHVQVEDRRRWIYSGVAVAAATIVAVVFLVPAVREADTKVSAKEILAKSATQLAATTHGVELLEYELALDGAPKELLADQQDGRYHVRQAIDHDVPGRFRYASFGADGTMISSIAQDPASGRRVMAFAADGQPYRYEVTLPREEAELSLPDMERLHMQASIALMQASGNQLVEEVAGREGPMYRIEVPRVSGPGTNPVWDLSEARVLVDGRDYRIHEFFVRGSFLKRDYSLSFTLISRLVASSVNADMFDVPHQPNEIVITGEGSALPAHDVLTLGLRELTKLKRAQ